MKTAYLLAAFAPLFGAVVAGFFGRRIGRAGAHWVTILGVAVSMCASFWVLRDVLAGNTFNGTLYTWMEVGGLKLELGFLIDRLTAVMLIVAGASKVAPVAGAVMLTVGGMEAFTVTLTMLDSVGRPLIPIGPTLHRLLRS